MRRSVTSRLELEVEQDAELVLLVAVADADLLTEESLVVTGEHGTVDVEEVLLPGCGRAHRFDATPGRYVVTYAARAEGIAAPARVTAADRLTYLRPSRYAEADRLSAIALAEFGGIRDPRELVSAVSSWVGTRLTYVPGASRPTDGAVETLLHREGVCRDYAHLVTALLRACDVPARLVAVYAPGLSPMDFHAVAEVAVGDTWYAVDATALAPRSALLRISTGRDAADTAFLSNYRGQLQLLDMQVSAVVDGELPDDDLTELVALG